MRTLAYILLLSITLLSCSGYTQWKKNITHDNIEFSKLRYSVNENNDTVSIIGYLKNDCDVYEIPAKADWVHFSKNWYPELICLSKDFEYSNVKLPKSSWLIREEGETGFSAVFPNDKLIGNYNCKGGGGAKGARTSFYKSGKLKSFFSESDVEIDGIKCKGGVFNYIKLYENGKLKYCTLAEDQKINGKDYRKGQKLKFNSKGKIIE